MTETPLRIGGRYDLGEVLGRGGMADVRRAHDSVLGRDVAIKLLRTSDELDRTRFDTEARLLALLSHENVVTVLDAGVDDGLAWLALELVDGDTLADRYRLGPLDPATLAVLGGQVAAALQHAHARGIVHRDVKPSNVLVDGADRARLTDFGIARLVDDRSAMTMTGHAVGTAAYIAPEQVAGEPVTTASDIYALGLLLLEGLTGRREYPGPPVEAALARLQRSPLVPVSLPTGWPALITAMTARQPAERPSADAVLVRLHALGRPRISAVADPTATTAIPLVVAPVAGAAVPVPAVAPVAAAAVPPVGDPDPEPVPLHARRDRRRTGWLLGAVAAAVALVVAMSAVLLGSSSGDDPAEAVVPTSEPGTTSTTVAPVARTTSPAPRRTSPTATPTTRRSSTPVTTDTDTEPTTPPRTSPRTKTPAKDKPKAEPKADPKGSTKGGDKGGGKGGGKGKGKG